jgi:hypothetical protein
VQNVACLFASYFITNFRGKLFTGFSQGKKAMQTSDAQKKFATFAPPLGDARRHALTLELDEQVFVFLNSWAAAQHVSVDVVLAQAAAQLAQQLTADTYTAGTSARALRFLDLDLDRLIEGSIDRSQAARTCGSSLCPSAYPQAMDSSAPPASPPADPENERRQEILGYYTALTGNRIKASDYKALREVFDLPDLIIQAGILHALCYATRPIGSFAYCVKAMDNFLDAAIDLEAACALLIDKLLLKRSTGQLVLPLAGEKLLIGDFKAK